MIDRTLTTRRAFRRVLRDLDAPEIAEIASIGTFQA